MNGSNGTLWETRSDGRLVELFDNELDLFRSGTLRMHKQPPCRFLECQQDWYLSEGKNAWHSRQMVAKEDWKFPTSCPAHRDLSKIRTIANSTELCEKTGKRSFRSKTEADTFSVARASNNGAPLQHSYECDSCRGFHLSSMTEDQQVTLERAKSASAVTTIISPSAAQARPPAPIDNKDAQICQLSREGRSPSEIGKQFGMHHLTVVKILRQYGLWTTSHAVRTPAAPVTSIKAASDTVESIDVQIQQLLHKKKMLEDIQRLRVEMVGEKAFKISKEGEHAVLPITDLELLINHLMSLHHERTRIQVEPTAEVEACATALKVN